MSDSSDTLISPPVTVAALAIAGGGLLVGNLFPDSSVVSMLGMGVSMLVILGLSGYVFAKGVGGVGTADDGSGSVSRPTMRKSIKGASDPSEIVLPHQTLFGIPMSILKALPAWFMIAILPFVFPGPPVMPVPTVGWVTVPWYAFPALGIVGFGLTCWHKLRTYNYI